MMSYRLNSRIAAFVLAAMPATPAAAQTIAITGGKVYPVSGPLVENGTVIITNGKIAAVGANVPIPAGAQRIDATGKIVTPGFVDASTQRWELSIEGPGPDRVAIGGKWIHLRAIGE